MSRPEKIGLPYLALFAALYATQGVVVAYLINFNKSYMIAAGVAEVTAGRVETAVLMTLVFKFLLGPLSDRVSPLGLGHRKPYIVLGLVLEALGMAGLACVHPGAHLAAYGFMALLAVVGLCLYDTCGDGMVIDVTPPEDRPRVQGSLQVARFLATMICTLAFGHWTDRTGIGPGKSGGVLWACAGLGLVPLALALPLREFRRKGDAEEFRWSALGVMARPHSLLLLAYGALYGIVGLGVEFNLTRYYIALEFDLGAVGNLSAIRYAGRAAGALLLPLAARSVGKRGRLTVGLVSLALTTAGQTLIHEETAAGFWAFVFGMSNGWNDALFCVLAMEASDPRMAASTFAIFMAVSNLSVAGNDLFLEAVKAFGGHYRPVFLGSSVLALLILALVPALGRPVPKPEPTDGADSL